MIDNERSSAIHTDESVDEKISLSDRFGLWIGFHNLSQNDFIKIIEKYCVKFDLVFNALHGGDGENGKIQKFFYENNIKFTGSNANASELAMDKHKAKKICVNNKILTQIWFSIKKVLN